MPSVEPRTSNSPNPRKALERITTHFLTVGSIESHVALQQPQPAHKPFHTRPNLVAQGRKGILQCGQTHPVQFRDRPRAQRNGFHVGQVFRSRRCREGKCFICRALRPSRMLLSDSKASLSTKNESVAQRIIRSDQKLVTPSDPRAAFDFGNDCGVISEARFANDSPGEARSDQALNHERLADR